MPGACFASVYPRHCSINVNFDKMTGVQAIFKVYCLVVHRFHSTDNGKMIKTNILWAIKF